MKKTDMGHRLLRWLPAFLVGCFLQVETGAQVPVPAPPQEGAILITGVRAHLGDGRVIDNAVIGLNSGVIVLCADATTVRIDRGAYARVIDGNGMEAYPGFIAPNSNLGLVEIAAVRATVDHREVGKWNPSVRSLIAYSTDSDVVPTIRSNGVLLAQVVPSGGVISGLSSVVQLDAWNWEDAAYLADDAIHLNWPSYYAWKGSWGNRRMEKNEKYDEEVEEIVQFFREAKAYSRLAEPKVVNLKMEAMKRLFDGDSRLHIAIDGAKAIGNMVHVLADFKLPIVIVGGKGADRVADLLRSSSIPVIIPPTHSMPSWEDSPIDEPFVLAKKLFDAGVLFCFSQEGFWKQRTLPHQAGQAVAFGLPYEVAIAALTKNTAQILGIGDRTGTLEVGKDANIILSEGDALDMRGNRIRHAFIQGGRSIWTTSRRRCTGSSARSMGINVSQE
jgi:hypothetical protein